MSEVKPFVNPFGDFERITLEDCKKQFTEAELKQLQEHGQHIVVRPKYYKFGDDLSEELLEKLNSLFGEWINSEVRHKIDKNGFIVEVEVLPQEMKAREHFPDFFEVYLNNDDTNENTLDVTGLFLTFIQGLGIDIQIDQELTEIEAITDTKPGKLTRVIFHKDTAQLQVTHKNYSGALSTRKNKYAYLVDIDRQLRLTWDDDGTPHITTADEQQAYNYLLNKKTIPAKCVDTDLLATFGAAVKAAYISNKDDRIIVDLPKLAAALGVRFDKDNSKDGRRFDFWEKIKQLENIGGVLVEQGKILRAFIFREYDQNENTLTFESPYLYSLMDILKNNPKVSKQKKDNKPLYSFEGVSYLIDAKIITARSKVTSEIVKNLVAGLFQHGIKTVSDFEPHKVFPDPKLIRWEITYKDLIKCTPLLKEYLQESDKKRRSQHYKRIIFGESYNPKSKKNNVPLVETYLKQYTEAFNYWVDLKITVEPVSMKDLDNKIILTHHGINGDFQNRLRLPSVEGQDEVLEES